VLTFLNRLGAGGLVRAVWCGLSILSVHFAVWFWCIENRWFDSLPGLERAIVSRVNDVTSLPIPPKNFAVCKGFSSRGRLPFHHVREQHAGDIVAGASYWDAHVTWLLSATQATTDVSRNG
jgi:hypothetical protein